MTQRKQKPKTLALSTLPWLGKLVPSLWSPMRPATLLEYLKNYRRDGVCLAMLAAAGASIFADINWLWIWPSLTILLALSEVMRASQFQIESKIFLWVETLRSYASTYDMAIKVWNAGLKYSTEEALATNNTHQLIQKYWELQYARRYLSESIDKAVRLEMKDIDWQKLEDYMTFFKDHCVQQ